MSDPIIVAPQRKSLDGTLRVTKVLGNPVYSPNGAHCGKVKDVVAEDNNVKGVVVRNGFTSYFIDIQHVKEYDHEAVMLTMEPYYLLLGKKVYDGEGAYIGKVKEVIRKRDTNTYTDIQVKKHFYSKPRTIPAHAVEVARDSVILRTKEE